MNLNDLETFVLVAEGGTFSEAARRLGVPKSTVSRRVARLEEELGRALLVRSSRAFVLSDDGRALFERCAPALREITRVEQDLGDSEATPRGRLRVTTSIDFGPSAFLADLLTDYSRRHPGVEVELQVTNRLVDLLEEGIDIAFRTHGGPLASRDDLVARRLGTLGFRAYAHPDVALQESPPVVSHHRVLRDALGREPVLTANDYHPVAALLAAGAGIGLLPDFVAGPFVARGQLVEVPRDLDHAPATVSLVWLRSRHLAPRVRAFIDLAVDHAGRSIGAR